MRHLWPLFLMAAPALSLAVMHNPPLSTPAPSPFNRNDHNHLPWPALRDLWRRQDPQ